MEATEMRRSTLQRKDRGELNQIAAALGAKPSSRARKDEIIQLIIDLTGDGGKAAAASEAGSTEADSPSDNPAPSASAGVAAQNSGNDTDTQAPANSAGRSRRRDGDTDNGEEAASNGRTQQPAQTQAPAQPQTQTQTQTQTQVEDEVEPPNRRRRRRNRDRDRDRDDTWDGDPVAVSGRLDLRDEGYGFLRVDGCLPNRNDAYVAVKTIRQFGLRRGDELTGTSRPANRAEKNPALLSLDSINGGAAELIDRPQFDQLTAIHALRWLSLEQPDDAEAVAARLIDLVAPIGVGQRVLVKAPRRSGAAQLLMEMISAIEVNEPDMYVLALFLDQRPEDITDIQRAVRNGEVAATSFDQSPDEHVQTAEMTIERAKRLVEAGRSVVVVLDSLTTLAHAYNASLSNAGRAYSGNVDSGAIHMPKKLFGAGRNFSEGGSLTIIATISTDGSGVLPGVLCDEFAEVANTEIVIDRWAGELGLEPAIDVAASVSRDESRFIDADDLQTLTELRDSFREAAGSGPAAGTKTLEAALARLGTASTNAELLR